MLRKLRPHLTYANTGTTVALIFATTGFAVAAIPSAGGTITGCYAKKKGSLRVVDARKKCARGEKRITWSQRGAKGDTGSAGLKGDAGAIGATGPQGTTGASGATQVIARSDAVVGTTAGTSRSAEVTCPTGQHATGGGVSVANMPPTDFKVVGSTPLDVDVPSTGWRGVIYPTTTDADALVFAYAICAAP